MSKEHPIPKALRDRFDQIEDAICRNRMERDAVFTQMRTAVQAHFMSAETEEGDHDGRQLEWERAENKRLREDLAKSQELSVTNILLDVVPGFDGMGEEVFAKSVAEVCEKLGELGLQAEELDSANSRLHEVSTHCATVEQELERLRAELGECKGEYDRAANKVDALRDQLDEALKLAALVSEASLGMQRKSLDDLLTYLLLASTGTEPANKECAQ